MTGHTRTDAWLIGIAIVGLSAAMAAAGLIWVFLTRPIAVVQWADKFWDTGTATRSRRRP